MYELYAVALHVIFLDYLELINCNTDFFTSLPSLLVEVVYYDKIFFEFEFEIISFIIIKTFWKLQSLTGLSSLTYSRILQAINPVTILQNLSYLPA